jgi:hypothetical protein
MSLGWGINERKHMKIVIECNDAWEAKGMLDWYRYKSTCEQIREQIRSAIKYKGLSAEAISELEQVQSLLYAEEETEI